jgi:acetylornithine deacetylase
MKDDNLHIQDAVELLKELIVTPSFSKEEDKTAGIISRFLAERGLETMRLKNNVISLNKHFDRSKPTFLLNSHHDTVRPNSQYTKNPFTPVIEEGKVYGLGSNDAGGALVSLIATFIYFYNQPELKYNLILAATAEEEISGVDGIEYVLQSKHFINAVGEDTGHPYKNFTAIVGEPTQMQMAVAEKGLLVLDCITHGKVGHAARKEGENAIYKAINDIQWFKEYHFPKTSELLGDTIASITVIETENKAHNVVPAECRFVVDIRINEQYTHEEILDIIRKNIHCDVQPRSVRLRSSMIPLDHPLIKSGLQLGKQSYGSPTSSDKALMPFPALKMGPGDSARSHIADEFIYINEIKEGIETYIKLLQQLVD